ncbi:Cadherin-23 [Orchesella cincta]|uniref:Cadherin-23 n=1 Tax=Orchesella cincta TaxID=48709 RepID=A0A1D2MFI5_ORCCI|nr:Cadherin-23 [Orchesella cincta]
MVHTFGISKLPTPMPNATTDIFCSDIGHFTLPKNNCIQVSNRVVSSEFVFAGQFCDSACLAEIEGAKSYAAQLHDNTNQDIDQLILRMTNLETRQKTYDAILERVVNLEYDLVNNITKLEKRISDDVAYVFTEIDAVRARVSTLESNEIADDFAFGDLSFQVSNLEKNLKGNTTQLSNQISNEIIGLNTVLSDYIASVNRDLNSRIDKVQASIPSTSPGNPTPFPPTTQVGSAMDVYYNLTRRIDNLEFGKISNLSADNNIWRQNFRVVNATFEKLKKNNYFPTGK